MTEKTAFYQPEQNWQLRLSSALSAFVEPALRAKRRMGSEFVIFFDFNALIAVKSGPLRGLQKPVPASRARRGSFVPLVLRTPR